MSFADDLVKIKDKTLYAMSTNNINERLRDLDVEFLHGVPVKLPEKTIDDIKSLLREVELEARKDELSQIDFGYHHIIDNMVTVAVVDDDGEINHTEIVDPRTLKDLFNHIQYRIKELDNLLGSK